MSLAKLVSLIETRSLFYASMDLLRHDDPFEGSLPRPTFEQRQRANMRDIDPATVVGYSIGGDVFRRWCYASCWCLQDQEDHLLWRVYGENHRGVAVQSTYQRLVDATRAEDHLGLVRYEDFDTYDPPSNNEAHFVFLKRREYQAEKEVRLVRTAFVVGDENCLGSKERAVASSDPRVRAFPRGFSDEVDLDQLIERIYVSPFADAWFAEAVAAYLKRVGLGQLLCESALRSKPLHDTVPITASRVELMKRLGVVMP
jgi:hypothetical protein